MAVAVGVGARVEVAVALGEGTAVAAGTAVAVRGAGEAAPRQPAVAPASALRAMQMMRASLGRIDAPAADKLSTELFHF